MWGRPLAWSTARIWALAAGGADEPGVIWCGTLPGGLFRSTDHGDELGDVRSLWDHPKRRQWMGGGADLPGIHSIIVDPRNSKRVWIAVSTGGIWFTEDGGATWTQRGEGMRADHVPPELTHDPIAQDVHCLVQCPAAPSRMWVQHHNGIFVSSDEGRNFTEINGGRALDVRLRRRRASAASPTRPGSCPRSRTRSASRATASWSSRARATAARLRGADQGPAAGARLRRRLPPRAGARRDRRPAGLRLDHGRAVGQRGPGRQLDRGRRTRCRRSMRCGSPEMASADDLRQIALSLAGTCEAAHFDRRAFKVARIYATLAADGRTANLKLSRGPAGAEMRYRSGCVHGGAQCLGQAGLDDRHARPARSVRAARGAGAGVARRAAAQESTTRQGEEMSMANDLVFYTNPMSRGRIVRWMLEEVGQPYETELLDYGTTMKAPAYLAINPMGKVPALRHGDTVVTECAAICAYLADAFPAARLAPPPGDRDRGPYYRWLFFAAGPLEAAVINNVARRRGAAGHRSPWSVTAASRTCSIPLEQAVKDREYLAGNRFSAADLYVGVHLGWGMQFGTVEKRKAFERYYDNLAKRPASMRAWQIDEALLPARPPGRPAA